MWQSKLQGETALSTTEAEIIALSQCMREVLAVRQVTQDAAETLEAALNPTSKIRVKVHEDNNGAISFAYKTGALSRTKHIHTKHWFFKEHIGEGSGIVVEKIDSADNLGDLFTKGVKVELVVPLRKTLMGWINWK